MPDCKICGLETTENVCPQCGSSQMLVAWILDNKIKTHLYVLYFLVIVDISLLKKVTPTFADVFNSFHAQLPYLTQMTINFSKGLEIFPMGSLVTIVFIFLLTRPKLRAKLKTEVLFVFSAVSAVLLFLFIAALFMPMFDLGNVAR